MQPADSAAADMLPAVLRRLLRHDLRLGAGRLDELLLAGAIERDEPERGVVDTMRAGGEQPVIMTQDLAVAANLAGHGRAALLIFRDSTRRRADHGVAVVERGGGWADYVQRTAGRAFSCAMDRVRVAHGHHVWKFLVHRSVQEEAGAVGGVPG